MRDYEHLPAYRIASQVNDALRRQQRLVVTAPPGAGKSTLLPLTILESLGERERVLMLEPRRLAARQIAERMAWMLGETVGQTVGYRIRFESRVSAQTRIEVHTEGILTRMLVDDPTLDGVKVVIFDEFHERSLTSDVALALTRESQQILRDDLRIVVMSATIDATAICAALDAPLVESEGRMHPIETRYLAAPSGTSTAEVAEAMAHAIGQAHREEEGDVLAFLPGEAEIRRCQELLSERLAPTRVLPLYGMLPPQEQQLAIAPSRPGERRVVLATPIAETSLTIEGVRVVIDSGLCRRMVYDPQSALSHLETVQISRDMADQRRGRAGRVTAGVCYRLWSLATEHRMEPCRQPEMLEADLAPMLLDIAAWGESHPERLPWLTPPPSAHLAQGRQLLQLLGATDGEGRITPHGRRLAKLPCHPRIAQMLVRADSPADKALACDLAALLDERDPLANEAVGTDIRLRTEALQRARNGATRGKRWERLLRIAEQYRRLVGTRHDAAGNKLSSAPERQSSAPHGAQDAGSLLAFAFPERIAQALPEGCGRFRLASGEQAQVELTDDMAASDWIVAVALHVPHIFLAAPVDPSALQPLAREREQLTWDNRQGRIIAQREWRIGNLLLQHRPLSELPRETLTQTLCDAVKQWGTSMLDFGDDVGNLQRRLAAVADWHPELALPDCSTEALLQCADQWLAPSLAGGRIPTTTAELRKLDVAQMLWHTLLSYDQQLAVDRIAPTHIAVPTGSRIRVEYRQGAELPILRVRLQECFGLTDTPRIDDGRRPILMELLSPGFKPVQLTQDLRSFWSSTYFEVRKELRRRYPKHAWPDDPLEAEPTRRVRKG